MTFNIQDLSKVDDDNQQNWPEGTQKVKDVNNAGRAEEGMLARWFADYNGSKTTTGTASALVVDLDTAPTAYYNGLTVVARVHVDVAANATLNAGGLGAATIKKNGGQDLKEGDLVSQTVGVFVSDGTNWTLTSVAIPNIGTEVGDLIVLEDVNGKAGLPAVDGSQLTGISTGSENVIINGGMQAVQRGTSIGNAINKYTLDRWLAYGGPANITVSQTAGLSASESTTGYALRFQRDSGDSQTNNSGIAYSAESIDSQALRGRTVALSFSARKGANYSSTSDVLNVEIKSGTGTDEKAPTFSGGATVASLNATLTDTFQTFTLTGDVSGTANQVGLLFNFTPTGTAGANDWFEICDVQLNVGSEASSFEAVNYGAELRRCQRYYNRLDGDAAFVIGVGMVTNATSAEINYFPPVTMRGQSTLEVSNVTHFQVNAGGTFYDTTNVVLNSVRPYLLNLIFTSSGMTVGHGCTGRLDGTAGAFIAFDAEL